MNMSDAKIKSLKEMETQDDQGKTSQVDHIIKVKRTEQKVHGKDMVNMLNILCLELK